jgi:hypothetical protein
LYKYRSAKKNKKNKNEAQTLMCVKWICGTLTLTKTCMVL